MDRLSDRFGTRQHPSPQSHQSAPAWGAPHHAWPLSHEAAVVAASVAPAAAWAFGEDEVRFDEPAMGRTFMGEQVRDWRTSFSPHSLVFSLHITGTLRTCLQVGQRAHAHSAACMVPARPPVASVHDPQRGALFWGAQPPLHTAPPDVQTPEVQLKLDGGRWDPGSSHNSVVGEVRAVQRQVCGHAQQGDMLLVD